MSGNLEAAKAELARRDPLAVAKAELARRNAQAAPTPKQAPDRQDISNTGGMSAMATQGALFGFGDEYLAGASAVLGVQPDGQGGADWFDYSKPIGERYDTALGAIRSEMGQYQSENPGKALAAQIGGGAVTAIGAAAALPVKAAATAVGRGAQMAGGGLFAGALEGYGSGEGGVKNRAVSSGVGALAGAVFAPIAGYGMGKIAQFARRKGGQALRSVFTNKKMFDPKTGRLSETGRKKLAELGYDASQLSDEMQASFGVAAERARQGGAGSAAVGRMAAAERFGVPITRGQATGDVIQTGAEESFRAGARGPQAMGTIGAFDSAQRAATEEARDAVGGRIGRQAIDRTDAADVVISGVKREAEAARQAGKAAYGVLEDSGAALQGSSINGLSDRIGNAVRIAGFTIGDETPNARSAMDFMRRKFENAGDGSIPFTTIESTRQQLLRFNRAAQSGSNGADQTVMRETIDAFDGWIDDAMTTALIQGDSAALKNAQKARGLWGKYRNTFLSKKGADNFIRKIVEDDLSPDQVAKWLYGGATTPGGGQTSLVARRIKGILGPDSDEWQSVKRAAWDHITKAPEGKSFGPQRVASNLAEFTNGKGKALARELFSADEIRQINEFRALMNVLTPPPRSTNPSGTAYALQRGMLEVLGFVAGSTAGPVGSLVGRETVSAGSNFTGNLAARAAVNGIIKSPVSVSGAIGSGVAAGAAAQERLAR